MKKPIIRENDRWVLRQFPDLFEAKLVASRVKELKLYRSIERTIKKIFTLGIIKK